MNAIKKIFLLFLTAILPARSQAEELAIGSPAPLFTLKNQDGNNFSLADRKGKGWTVLYFYPKAATPGCTKEACAFRDSIQKIKALKAEVYGISSDTVEAQKAFHSEHKLSFDLLADPEMTAIGQFGAKMPLIGLAKRWTFIIDSDLKVRSIEKDVDPLLDAERVAKTLADFEKK